MKNPSDQALLELKSKYGLEALPVVLECKVENIQASQIYKSLHLGEGSFIWESSSTKERQAQTFSQYRSGRYSYIGACEEKIAYIAQNKTLIEDRSSESKWEFDTTGESLEETLKELSYRDAPSSSELQKYYQVILPPFIGGAFGFIGYDAANYFEHIKGHSFHQSLPEVFIAQVSTLVAIDSIKGTVSIILWPTKKRSASECEILARDIQEAIFSVASESPNDLSAKDSQPVTYELSIPENSFCSIVKKAKEYIRAGDIFQVVLSNALNIKGEFEPTRLHDTLKTQNPSPYHFLFQFKDSYYVGASPEVMLRSEPVFIPSAKEQGMKVIMRLVAGTYPIDQDTQTVVEQANKLIHDEKEKAEHIMLVDHARNDIGKVARIGSVEVSDLFSVERYAHIHHIVSQVSGVLKPGCTVFSALKACFPIATLTGTPKIRAMEIIAELEGPSRGIFGGAVFFSGHDGLFDSAVAIRSAVINNDSACVQVGAGIVHDSLPEREHQECLLKARSMLNALASCRKG